MYICMQIFEHRFVSSFSCSCLAWHTNCDKSSSIPTSHLVIVLSKYCCCYVSAASFQNLSLFTSFVCFSPSIPPTSNSPLTHSLFPSLQFKFLFPFIIFPLLHLIYIYLSLSLSSSSFSPSISPTSSIYFPSIFTTFWPLINCHWLCNHMCPSPFFLPYILSFSNLLQLLVSLVPTKQGEYEQAHSCADNGCIVCVTVSCRNPRLFHPSCISLHLNCLIATVGLS